MDGGLIQDMMIVSFRDRETELIWQGVFSRRLPRDIQSMALRKLRMLNNASSLTDLKAPPNNQLEALKGDRAGQHSIRINKQWRICFEWTKGGPERVEIVDYH
jgi:toxin HigB-1